MICKYCGQELPEESTFCAFCGQSLEEAPQESAQQEVLQEENSAEQIPAEEMPAEEAAEDAAAEDAPMEEALAEAQPVAAVPARRRTSVWLIILAIIGGLSLAVVLAGAVLYGLGIDLRPRSNDILCKDNYSVEDKVAEAKKDVVIAKVGDKELTNGGLQVYYWETVYSYINNNYYYLSMYGLDTTKPLNEQPFFGDPTKTWQQFFLETALSSWQRYTTLQLLAQEDQFRLDEQMQSFLDTMDDTVAQTAANAGYDTIEGWLKESCGPGCSEAGYMDYVRAYYESTSYLVDRYDELMPNADEVAAYFTENESVFTQNGITKEGKYYDVRHILIGIEGGTTQEDGTVVYSDEEWETCRSKAQTILDEFLAGDGTEDEFAQLAMLHSVDGGSSTNGGLYTDLTTETNFVPEFKEWYLDPARTAGDTGLVKTTYGYHIMYFSASRDIWYTAASEQLLADRVNVMIEEGMARYPMVTSFKKIVLGTKETL